MSIWIIILICLPTFFWLPTNEIIAHGLFFPWPSSDGLFSIFSYHLSTWTTGPHYSSASSLYYFYIGIINSLFPYGNLAQRIIILLSFIFLGLSIYYLARKLKLNKISSLIASIFYIITPAVFTGMPLEIVNIHLSLFYISSPLLLASLIGIHENKDYFLKNLAKFSVFIFFIAIPSYSSPQYFILHLILILTFEIFILFKTIYFKRDVKKDFLKILTVGTTYFLLNFFWIFSLLTNIAAAYNDRKESGFSDLLLLKGTSVHLTDTFRFLPYPTQVSSSSWIEYYYSPSLTFIELFLIAIIAFSLFNKKTSSYIIYVGILFSALIFLGKGVLPPFSALGEFIFLSSDYIVRLFRNLTYFNALLVLPGAMLLGMGTNNILLSIKSNKIQNFFTALVIMFLLIYGYPFFTGISIKSQNKTESFAQTVRIPQYFKDLNEYLRNKPEDAHILEIPVFTQQSWFVSLAWDGGSYRGVPPISAWSGKFIPDILSRRNINPQYELLMSPSLSEISQKDWEEMVYYSNSKYLVYYHDVDWDFLKGRGLIDDKREQGIKSFIKNNPKLTLERKFGEIDLYKINDNLFNQIIYPSSGNSLPNLEFKKLHHTKYLVKISKIKNKFTLNFLETYNPKWKIYPAPSDIASKETNKFISSPFNNSIQNENLNNPSFWYTWIQNPLPFTNLATESIGNSWEINPQFCKDNALCIFNTEDEGYSLNLIIEYTPQRNLLFGLIVSFSTIITVGLLSLKLYAKNKK